MGRYENYPITHRREVKRPAKLVHSIASRWKPHRGTKLGGA